MPPTIAISALTLTATPTTTTATTTTTTGTNGLPLPLNGNPSTGDPPAPVDLFSISPWNQLLPHRDPNNPGERKRYLQGRPPGLGHSLWYTLTHPFILFHLLASSFHPTFHPLSPTPIPTPPRPRPFAMIHHTPTPLFYLSSTYPFLLLPLPSPPYYTPPGCPPPASHPIIPLLASRQPG